MNRNKKALFIVQKLEELYVNPSIPLQHKDSYTLLIAVLLSARCTDERVNLVTPYLFKLADNPQDMILHSVDKIREIISNDPVFLFEADAAVLLVVRVLHKGA